MMEFLWTIGALLASIIGPTLNVLFFVIPIFVAFAIIIIATGDSDLNLWLNEKLGKKPECLCGQVVWITGASSGIGEALAYRLARAGCKLILSARREDELNRVRNACIALSQKVKKEDIMVLPFDLLKLEDHKEVVHKALLHFSEIDILVNNGARSQRAWIKDTPIEIDREIINILVLAPVSLTKALLPHWIERNKGQLVFTSSGSAKIGTPSSATYSLGKLGMHGFLDALRIEHYRDNIHVNIVCPGPVFTNIRLHSFTATQGESYGKLNSPSEKRMSAERCADLMAISIANNQGEAWISCQPTLFLMYAAQYMPDIFRMLSRKYGLKAASMVRPVTK